MEFTMSRIKSRTRNYHLRGWIFKCNWQCQGKNPGQGIITLEVESSDSIHNLKPKIWHKELKVQYFDAIHNVKDKIQDKEFSPQRLNLQIQLTTSRWNFKTRNYDSWGCIFWCNQQYQGPNPKQVIITLIFWCKWQCQGQNWK